MMTCLRLLSNIVTAKIEAAILIETINIPERELVCSLGVGVGVGVVEGDGVAGKGIFCLVTTAMEPIPHIRSARAKANSLFESLAGNLVFPFKSGTLLSVYAKSSIR